MNELQPNANGKSSTPSASSLKTTATELQRAFEDVRGLYDQVAQFEASMQSVLASVHRHHRASARNLLHYLAIRRHDVRDLQGRLAALGLSSLGRSESSVLITLQRVLAILARLTEKAAADQGDAADAVCVGGGEEILARNTVNLLGPDPNGRNVRIMVTMSEEAAHNYEHVRDLLQHGMNCMRVNCSHDDSAVWQQMIQHLHRAREETNKPCCLLMDLGGPKVRTGPIAPGPAIHKWRPTRDEFGRLIHPVLVQLVEALDESPRGFRLASFVGAAQ